MDQDTETTQKILSTFKISTRESLKNIIQNSEFNMVDGQKIIDLQNALRFLGHLISKLKSKITKLKIIDCFCFIRST